MKHFFEAILVSALFISCSGLAHAQSTATLSGTVTDPSGAVVPGAQVSVVGNATGLTRTVVTDSVGSYTVPSLPPGDYQVRATAAGFSTFVVKNVTLQVDQRTTINMSLGVAATGEEVQVNTSAPLIDAQTMTVGQVIDQKTVQQVPLNGRHFLDLTVLVPGSVVPPVNGFLTSASRGLGANAYITAGNREDSANYMINGINLNDLTQNQITFQPSINTTAEFKISNSTYSAEYGRSSGSIVNVATRSGTNAFHGEGFDYLRNNYFDARNFFNRKPDVMNSLRRNNFGGAFSGPVWRDKTFFFLSYEGLRQSQDILLRGNVLTAAQRTQFASSPAGPAYAKLISFIPVGVDSVDATGKVTSVIAGSSAGPVKTDQYSGDLYHRISAANNLHFYYAWQQDARTEPNLQGNTIAGFGDHRTAHRQIGTINDVHIFSPNVVNEGRFGFNRIAIAFTGNTRANPANYGINTGVTTGAGLPQITVNDLGLNFGGPSPFPQGRFVTTYVVSDTLNYIRGRHSLKLGDEFRRFNGNNFQQNEGVLSFSTTANFIKGLANSFSVTPTNVASRIFINAASGFAQDSWKVTPRFIAEMGFRFEWNGTPTEGAGRFVDFLQDSVTLQRVSEPYKQNYNYEPRVGFTYDVLGKTKTVVRGGFAIMADQPTEGVVTNLASNPPNATPLVVTAPSGGGLPVATLFTSAKSSGLAPNAVNPKFRNGYLVGYNLNVQQDVGAGTIVQLGYIGSGGRHLRVPLNINQFIYPSGPTGVRPFPTVSAASPILPGKAIGNINYIDSNSISNYNAMWLTVRKALWYGLQFNTTYTWSKSMDEVSQSAPAAGQALQNNFSVRDNYGPSDFDVRNRFVFSGTWELPFHGNRLKEGWLLANITQLQSGNPLNVVTTSTYTGTAGNVRPTLIGRYSTGRGAILSSGNVSYIHGSACATIVAGCTFYAQPAGFGTLRRNALAGPGFSDTDLSLQKTTKIAESVALVLRVDAFDLLNHTNFGNPVLTATGASTSTFGQIRATRTAVGDAGSSRQLQFAGKITF